MVNPIYDQYKITAAGRSTQMIIEASSYTTTPSHSPPIKPENNNAEEQAECFANAEKTDGGEVQLYKDELLKVKQPQPNHASKAPYFWLNGQGHGRSIPSFNAQSYLTVPDQNKQAESQSEARLKEISKQIETEAVYAPRTSLCKDTNQDAKSK